LEVLVNQAPQPPTIIGSSKLKPGMKADFTVFTVDPEQHNVYYYIEWGDGSSDGWDGPFESNERVSFSHTWDEKGSYEINAKAKDTHEAESSVATFPVQMSKSKISDDSPFSFLLYRLIERYPMFSFLFP
jgi:hypothetical protein